MLRSTGSDSRKDQQTDCPRRPPPDAISLTDRLEDSPRERWVRNPSMCNWISPVREITEEIQLSNRQMRLVAVVLAVGLVVGVAVLARVGQVAIAVVFVDVGIVGIVVAEI